MAVIALEGMQFHAFHGYYEEEQKMGNIFLLDVYVTTASIAQAAATDDLDGTINYETIYFICKSEMKTTAKMLETVAQRILDRLSFLYGSKTQNIKVRLKKMNPPLGGKVACAYIEIESAGGGGGGGGSPSRAPTAFFGDDDDDDDDDFDFGADW